MELGSDALSTGAAKGGQVWFTRLGRSSPSTLGQDDIQTNNNSEISKWFFLVYNKNSIKYRSLKEPILHQSSTSLIIRDESQTLICHKQEWLYKQPFSCFFSSFALCVLSTKFFFLISLSFRFF